MFKPINSIIKDSIGNIMFRGNVVTGTVAVDNGDGSYDVFISESDRAYPKIFTLSRNPNLAVGDKVRILYKNGCKELPIILPPVAPSALTLYENQIVTDDDIMNAYGTRWLAYFFQAESDHNVSEIQLYVKRYGSPGTVTVSLYPNEGSGNHKPVISGGALTTGTIDGNSLSLTGEWKAIPVISYSLISGTWYSIILKATSGDINNIVKWFGTNDDVAVEKWRHSSNNSGVNWYSGAFDLTFKIYGN